MVRTQVYLTAEQHKALRKQAKRDGVSMTELLRRIVDEKLAGRRGVERFSKEDVLSLVGIGASGRTDGSERHDDVLDEALRDEAVR